MPAHYTVRHSRYRSALLASLLAAPLFAVQAAEPAEVITSFHATLTEAMNKSVKLGCQGRMKLVQPAVDEAFDLAFLSEHALRRYWKTLDSQQHKAFVAALRSSVVTTYSAEFAQAGAVTFSTTGSERLANGDVLVHTLLTPKGEPSITLDYVMKPRDTRWQVVNVLADGVSDLALRATQYDALMKSNGFDALMTRLEVQTQQLKARCP